MTEDGDGGGLSADAAERLGAGEASPGEVEDAVGPGTDRGSAGGSGSDGDDDRALADRIVGALLETEPDETPDDYPDLPEHTAHFVIGVKKVVNHLSEGGVDTGTPAAVNFGLAAYHAADATPAEGEGGGGSGDDGDTLGDAGTEGGVTAGSGGPARSALARGEFDEQ
jgi:hypothetical protein